VTGPRGLLDVRRFVLTSSAINPAMIALKEAGARCDEAFALLGGTLSQDGEALEFTSCFVPEQTPYRTPDGVMVEVSGSALHRANLEFYRRGEIMAGQVHSHPSDAYHSQLDDALPLVTLLGALSVVIPDFAAAGTASLDRWACYRLIGPSAWRAMKGEELEYRT